MNLAHFKVINVYYDLYYYMISLFVQQQVLLLLFPLFPQKHTKNSTIRIIQIQQLLPNKPEIQLLELLHIYIPPLLIHISIY